MESGNAMQIPGWANEMLCGCKIPDPNSPKPSISFSKVIPEAPVQAHFDPLVPPQTTDYLAPFKEWKKLGNDRYGDCVPVTWANMRRLVTSRLTGREQYPSMSQVMELYKIFNPENGQDDGVGTQDLLKHLVDNGGPDGVHAIAFAKIDVDQSLEAFRQALAIFGCVWIGISVHQPNRDEFDFRQPWTRQTTAGSQGHSALVGGYSAEGNLKMVTWGGTAQVTKECAFSQIFEAWVVMWPEHLGSRRFMRGIDLTQLRSEYQTLTNRSILPFNSSSSCVHYTFLNDEESSGKFIVMNTIIPNGESVTQARYDTPSVAAITPISKQRALTGSLLVDNDDLYLIRTTETTSDFVEVFRSFGPSYYDLENDHPMVTLFKSRPKQHGIFTIDNGDLYFIETEKTSSGFIEVYFAAQEQLFQTIDRYVTAFQQSDNVDKCTIRGGDLYLLTKRSVENRSILQIQCAGGSAHYSKASKVSQAIELPFQTDTAALHIASNGDLYIIKSTDTMSGKVEIFIAQAQDNYESIKQYPTSIDTKQDYSTTKATTKRTWIV